MRYWYLCINQFSKPFPEEEFTRAEKILHDPVTWGQVGHPRLRGRKYTVILGGGRRWSDLDAPFTRRRLHCDSAGSRADEQQCPGGLLHGFAFSLSVICEAWGMSLGLCLHLLSSQAEQLFMWRPFFCLHVPSFWASLVTQLVKNLPAMQETGLIPGLGSSPEKG